MRNARTLAGVYIHTLCLLNKENKINKEATSKLEPFKNTKIKDSNTNLKKDRFVLLSFLRSNAKKEQGITLVALSITIIVLIILARGRCFSISGRRPEL